MKKKDISKIKENFNKDILLKTWPLWSRKYDSFFEQSHIESNRVDREQWVIYMSEKISSVKERLYCCLELPYLPFNLREYFLKNLYSVSLKDIDFKFSFKSEIDTLWNQKSLYFQLKMNKESSKRELNSQLCWHDGFSFLIVDNNLIFEPPAQPYHNFRTIFEIHSVNEYILRNSLPEIFCENRVAL